MRTFEIKEKLRKAREKIALLERFKKDFDGVLEVLSSLDTKIPGALMAEELVRRLRDQGNAIERLHDALWEIKECSDPKNPGCCVYGCDTPDIARRAIEKEKRLQ